jgi:hypothetical protein
MPVDIMTLQKNLKTIYWSASFGNVIFLSFIVVLHKLVIGYVNDILAISVD